MDQLPKAGGGGNMRESTTASFHHAVELG